MKNNVGIAFVAACTLGFALAGCPSSNPAGDDGGTNVTEDGGTNPDGGGTLPDGGGTLPDGGVDPTCVPLDETCGANSVCCAGTCNAAAGTSCAATTCSGGVQTVSSCNASGSCVTTMPSCNGYACNGAACRTSCAGDAECVSTHYCATGACVRPLTSPLTAKPSSAKACKATAKLRTVPSLLHRGHSARR